MSHESKETENRQHPLNIHGQNRLPLSIILPENPIAYADYISLTGTDKKDEIADGTEGSLHLGTLPVADVIVAQQALSIHVTSVRRPIDDTILPRATVCVTAELSSFRVTPEQVSSFRSGSILHLPAD